MSGDLEPRGEDLGPRLGTYTPGLRLVKVVSNFQGVRFKAPLTQTQAVALAVCAAVEPFLWALWLGHVAIWWPFKLAVLAALPVGCVLLLWRTKLEGRTPAQALGGLAQLAAGPASRNLAGPALRRRSRRVTVGAWAPAPEDEL